MIFRNCYTSFHEPLGEWNLRQFWNITSGIYAKYHVQIMLLFVYTTIRKRFVIFTCRYFKLRWNTTALSQSNCRNFSCSSISRIMKCSSWNHTLYLYCLQNNLTCGFLPFLKDNDSCSQSLFKFKSDLLLPTCSSCKSYEKRMYVEYKNKRKTSEY